MILKKLLGLDKANVYVTGFDRPNLSFSVIRTPKRMDYVVHYVRQHANEMVLSTVRRVRM